MSLKRLSVFIILTALIFSVYPASPSFASGASHLQAAVVGKVIHYDLGNDAFIVYGRLSVKKPVGWRVVEVRKFYRVHPFNAGIRDALKTKLGSGVKAFGSFHNVSFSRGEYLIAKKVIAYDPNSDIKVNFPPAYGPGIGPVEWTGFGFVLLPQRFAKFDIPEAKVTDFVDVLASLRSAVLGENGETSSQGVELSTPEIQSILNSIFSPKDAGGKALRQRVQNAWRSRWYAPWFLEKDLNVLNECRRAVRGAAFFIGQIGGGNGYIESVPVIRPDVDAFMDVARTGGRAVVVEGPAVMFAEITATRDEHGQIVELNASGPLFETPREIVQGIASRTQESETWRLEGWNQNRASFLDKKQKSACVQQRRRVDRLLLRAPENPYEGRV